jgi:hypothetical protein
LTWTPRRYAAISASLVRGSSKEKTAIRMFEPRVVELMLRMMWVKRIRCCARLPRG